MSQAHKHVGLKILAKIKIYILSRAKLLITVWDEIPCSTYLSNIFSSFQGECDTNLFASGGEDSFVEAAGKGDLNSMACLLDETYDEIIDQQGM